ncbi:MAG: M56 family metallopeptidase [Syntrophomonadaceae bacterium]|jgi:beta-lactamase regulating signal transducer with metallopeptidase domain
MSSYFITVLNMSLTASYVVLAVIIVRLLIKRAPKIFSYALWAIVLFRLVCPFSFESNFSLIPNNNEIIPRDIIYSQNPAINTGVTITDKAINQSIQSTLPPVNPAASVNPMGIALEIGAIIWILGIVALLAYALISYFRLKRRLSTATLVNDNIYETDGIKTPFVLGLIQPGIYIPTNLSGSELGYIIKHEETHIRRYDYIIKPVAFLALVIHWFNPLIWISYFLMVKDMEMSCDESVMKQFSGDIRASYSNSLLSLSIKQSGLLSPLAFGESNVKSRIKNVLNYRKPAFWTVVIIAVAAIVISAGLMVDPVNTITYKNEALGFSLKLPKDWEGKYIIKETDNNITIFNKKIYEKYDGMGRIASVERQIGEMITAEDMLQAPVGQQIVLQGNGFTYFIQMPSDVQYPLDDTAFSNEYNDMSEQMADISRSIALIGKRQPVAANQGFKVKGTSFFTIEIPQGWEMKAMEGFPPYWTMYVGDQQVGRVELVPYNSTERFNEKYLLDDQALRKVHIVINPEDTNHKTIEKIINSFQFAGGPYNVVDLLTAAEEYVARGGERIFGQIAGFKMENGKPVAVHVKIMKFIPDGPGDDNPNGFLIEDLNQTKTYTLDWGVHIVPLVAPNHHTYGIYEMPLLDETFINNYPDYGQFFYDFIIGSDGQLKFVLGRYIP